MNQRRLSTSQVFVNYVDELRRVLIGVLMLMALIINGFLLLVEVAEQRPITPILPLFLGLVGLSLLAVVRRFAVQLTSDVIMLIFTLRITSLLLLPSVPFAVIVVLVASLINSRWAYAVILVAAPAQVFWSELNRAQPEDGNALLGTALILIVAAVSSLVLRVFRERLDVFLESARQTSSMLQRSLQLSSSLAGYTDEASLAQYTARGLQKQFDLLRVGVYLVQQSNEAALIAATDEKLQGQRLPINTRSTVGRALLSGETITLRLDTLRAADPSLRVGGAQVQAVIPLFDRDRVVGALDLYSADPNAFTVDALNTLKVVALGFSQALRQTRTLAEQQTTLQQMRRVSQENEVNLREVERLSRQLTRQIWSEYVRTGGAVTGVKLEPNGFSPGAAWTPPMVQAVQGRRPVSAEAEEGGRWVAVPIELRGEVIGALQVKLADASHVNETTDLLRTVSERLAISLENARLFEEAQAATIQEQRVNEIIAELQAGDSLEAMLQRTLEGLADALGTSDLSIRLGNVAMQGTNGGSHAS